jgi:DNA-binding MarR family transcriptional regulator
MSGLDALDDAACRLRQAYRRVAPAIQRHGLVASPESALVLRALAKHGELGAFDLCHFVYVGHINNVTGRLVAKGLVTRRGSEADKRRAFYAITDAGREVLDDLDEAAS